MVWFMCDFFSNIHLSTNVGAIYEEGELPAMPDTYYKWHLIYTVLYWEIGNKYYQYIFTTKSLRMEIIKLTYVE